MPGDQKRTEPVPSSAKNGDAEYSALAERKERIIRLRLGNDCRRAELAVLRRESAVDLLTAMKQRITFLKKGDRTL